jgi:ribonucleoside-diphosphate reductase alpha chain
VRYGKLKMTEYGGNWMSVRIVKRNGEKVEYSSDKIKNAIRKAMAEGEGVDENIVDEIEAEIREEVENEFHQGEFTVEMISDMTEDKLLRKGFINAGRRFILYRREHAELRNKKWEMTDLQHDIWSQKYEFENEGFDGFLDRVSGGNKDLRKLIRDKKFLFGGRILAGRGLNEKGIKTTYSNCYVLSPPEDNLESIFNTARDMARVFSYGGGVGISLEKLRPRGAKVHNSAKATTGACSFADLYSMTTGLIGQSNRRGALMLSIPCNHPDLEEFINMKSDLSKVTKANISVMLYDDFMEAVVNKEDYKLTFTVEDTGEVIEKIVNADKMFTLLAKLNWSTGEPGAIYWDTITNNHLMSEDVTFVYAGVNPCARWNLRLK